jgi:hypothetical protein
VTYSAETTCASTCIRGEPNFGIRANAKQCIWLRFDIGMTVAEVCLRKPCLYWYDTGRGMLDGNHVNIGMILAEVCLMGTMFILV